MSLPARKLSSLRDLLRTSTADQHAALEATPVMRAFADGATDARVARAYLTRQERLHRALERTLAPHLTPRESQLRLQRSTWLADDLHTLGIAPDAREPSVPAVTDRAGALGVLYVLEGSTLGLRMVRNRLQRGDRSRSRDRIARIGRDQELRTFAVHKAFLEALRPRLRGRLRPALAVLPRRARVPARKRVACGRRGGTSHVPGLPGRLRGVRP